MNRLPIILDDAMGSTSTAIAFLSLCFAPLWAQDAHSSARSVEWAAPPRALCDALALQISLEARGYSPGLLDGALGLKTRLALAAFQAAAGLPATGEASTATLALLSPDPQAALAPIKISAADLAEVDPPPRDWIERSRKQRLLYPSLANLVAERAHTTERLLAALNPGVDLSALRPGDVLQAPAVNEARKQCAPAGRIEIDLDRKLILVFSSRAGETAPAGLLHCSIAADPARAPEGEARIAVVAADPVYTFDPAKWPEVRGVNRKLRIPPGPRSPVGLRWIGLDLEGIGIHGVPEPEMIGKTGSHGCFRLTNWDAIWLAGVVQIGTPVRIVRNTSQSSWVWGR
jgi:lipoprotein-anchoring transpeptidase ErfK/SrfK